MIKKILYKWKKIKDILNFCNAAVVYEYTNIGITCELNQVRKCIIYSFYKTIPLTRILVSLSINDNIILKVNDIDIENIIEKFHDLRENFLYRLSFEKIVRDEQQKVIEPKLIDEKKIRLLYIVNDNRNL